jgi:hypothetical protein
MLVMIAHEVHGKENCGTQLAVQLTMLKGSLSPSSALCVPLLPLDLNVEHATYQLARLAAHQPMRSAGSAASRTATHGLQSRIEALQFDNTAARTEISSLQCTLEAKEGHVKAARDAEASLARRLSHVQTAASEAERVGANALVAAQAETASAEQRSRALQLDHEHALQDEKRKARELVESLTLRYEERLEVAHEKLAGCERRLEVRWALKLARSCACSVETCVMGSTEHGQ